MRCMWKRMRRQDGFTLVELIVVVAILGILAAVITPRVLKAVDDARENSALAFGKEIQLAMERYYVENGHYPDDGTDVTVPPEKKMTTYDELVERLGDYVTIDREKLGEDKDDASSFYYSLKETNNQVGYELELVFRESEKKLKITPESVTIVDGATN